jgi:DNA-nicking Smr family endonuclease|tara:strand:+ start:147 stop:563 length:417 start_codon:yes stop_codon:yes gene_type:complete
VKKKDVSLTDLQSWKEYTDNPKDVYDKDLGKDKQRISAKRYKFDLHGYSLNDANIKVSQIILFCSEKNYSEILLITGKGIHSNTDKNYFVSKDLSKLRFSIPDFINTSEDLNTYVSSISVAEDRDGGEGALIVKLKKL